MDKNENIIEKSLWVRFKLIYLTISMIPIQIIKGLINFRIIKE
jgi:hypothetical protein